MNKIIIALFLLSLALPAADDFGIRNPELSGNGSMLSFEITAPDNGYVDAASLALEVPGGHQAFQKNKDAAIPAQDYPQGIYRNGAVILFQITPPVKSTNDLSVTLQGCTEGLCNLPQAFSLDGSSSTPDNSSENTSGDLEAVLANFQHAGTLTGYHDSQRFCNFLSGKDKSADNILMRIFRRFGLLFAALAVMPLGFLLNLTPCVLPMIPITLGILGTSQKGRKHGLALGTAYGAGMALSYGAIGILCVLLGGQFGEINSSALFNLVIALVFLALAAAMLDFFSLDLSRFRNATIAPHGTVIGAFLLGVLCAVLASACIAPVLVWVILLSAQLYQEGRTIALILPLLLGLGLGSPWPLLGAGIAHLPRPGAWMVRVRQFFAVLIIIAAGYFFHCAWLLHHPSADAESPDGPWRKDAIAALTEALDTHTPVLLDFWGVACKACAMMDHTTLQSPEVMKRLEKLMPIKIQADDLQDKTAAGLVKYYHVIGMPTYILLVP